MMNYAETIYLDSSATYPAGETFDRLVVLEDATFTTFSAGYTVGDTTTKVTATEIASAPAGFVFPGAILDVAVSDGKVLISRG